MIKPNIGIVNALIRITVGLTLVTVAGAKYSKKPWRESLLLIIMLGAMKVGEGILRFCPVTLMFQRAAESKEESGFQSEANSSTGKDTYNPS
ncbi:YgaP family membrane protein [Metabacillus sp. RGM 3146]|uniref:YgaP family membrane protein n=1 Tax=Metabacillus sp. RGM 3146 TaxID=3401092 RepID=UPI003B9A388B